MLRKFLLMLGYLGLAVFVAGITVALVAYGNDYAYDFATHKIIQKGHVIIHTTPGGVAIAADGKNIHKKSPYQAAYSVGLHAFKLTKAGYMPWQKTIVGLRLLVIEVLLSSL